MVTAASSGPATVIRTGPAGTPSNVNRPKRSASCSSAPSGALQADDRRRAGTSWPTSRRVAGSATITSISRPGAWNVSWRAPPWSRTPVSSVAESNTRSASSWSIVRHVNAPRAAASDVVGHGIGLLQGAPEQFVQGVVVRDRLGDDRSLLIVHLLSGRCPPGAAGGACRDTSPWLGPMLPIERPRISAIVW